MKSIKTIIHKYINIECVIIFLITFFIVFHTTYYGLEWLFGYKENFIITDKRKKKICKIMYNDKKRPRTFKIIKNLLTIDQCQNIIAEAEAYAKEFEWTTDRHDNYPTTDNEITNIWESYNLLSSRIYKIIIPELANMYKVETDEIGLNEIFVAKYNHNAQNKLNAHEDGSEFSFVIALNDDYEGGGTYFTKLKKKASLKMGDALIFSGQEKHQGLSVIKGKRYIIAGFLNYARKDYCEDLFDEKSEDKASES